MEICNRVEKKYSTRWRISAIIHLVASACLWYMHKYILNQEEGNRMHRYITETGVF